MTLPRSAKCICLGDDDSRCRLVLCPLGERLLPSTADDAVVSFAPGNAEVLLGSSTSCEIVKPEGWDGVWSSTSSGAPFERYLYVVDKDVDGASNIVEFYGTGFIKSLYTDGPPSSSGIRTNPFDPNADGDLLLDSYELCMVSIPSHPITSF